MSLLRQLGLGCTFFRSKFFTDNTKGIYDFTCDFNITPALIPPMTWAGKRAPSAVTELKVKRSLTADILSWQKATDHSGADYLLYNVYASKSYPVDINNPANLISVRQREQAITVPHKGYTLHYAVTAMNRYGLESQPVNLKAAGASSNGKPLNFQQLIRGNKLKKYKNTKK